MAIRMNARDTHAHYLAKANAALLNAERLPHNVADLRGVKLHWETLNVLPVAAKAAGLAYVVQVDTQAGETIVRLHNATPEQCRDFVVGKIAGKFIDYRKSNAHNCIYGVCHWLRKLHNDRYCKSQMSSGTWITTDNIDEAMRFETWDNAHNASINGGEVLGPFPSRQ